MNLTHDAMLVSLRINSWSGRLYDRQASQQVAMSITTPTPTPGATTNASCPNRPLPRWPRP